MRKLLPVLTFGLLVSMSASAQTQQPTRVNCGGPAYTDSKGQLWAADSNFNSGTNTFANNNAISGTADSRLFQSERWGKAVIYSFSIPNGSYRLNLLLAEIYWNSVGSRVFNVKLQGVTVDSNVDIFAQAGGSNIALIKSYNAVVSNGTITLELDATGSNIDGAKCSAIEILPITASPALVTLTVNPGSSALFDDGTAIMPNSTASVTELENGAWIPIGTVTSDASGSLTGSIKVSPSFVSNGNVWLSLSMAGIPAPGGQGVDPRMLQQGSTGVTLKLVVFKAVLLPKSISLALTP